MPIHDPEIKINAKTFPAISLVLGVIVYLTGYKDIGFFLIVLGAGLQALYLYRRYK